MNHLNPVSATSSPQVSTPSAPSIHQRLEDFYYTSTWKQFSLNGTPNSSNEYGSIANVHLSQDRVGIVARTATGIVEDLWQIVWQNRDPVLQFKERLAFGVQPIQTPNRLAPNKMEAIYGDDRLLVETENGNSRVTINRAKSAPLEREFQYSRPTSIAFNAKWAAIAWEGKKISVFGRDEYKNYEVTYVTNDSSSWHIQFMLLDDKDGLLTLSIKGLIEEWRLPSIFSQAGGRVNSTPLFRGPFERPPMDDSDFEQLAGTIDCTGQLGFIGHKQYGNRIFLHLGRPFPPELLDSRKRYLQTNQATALVPMSRTMACALFPKDEMSVKKLQQEAYALRMQMADPSDKLRIKELEESKINLEQQIARLDDTRRKTEQQLTGLSAAKSKTEEQLNDIKRQTGQQLASLSAAKSEAEEKLAKIASELAGQEAKNREFAKKNLMLNDAATTARLQAEQLQAALTQAQRELTQMNGKLKALSAKEGTDPVSWDPLIESVSLACGHIFNRSTVEGFRNKGYSNCPLCRANAPASQDRQVFLEQKTEH